MERESALLNNNYKKTKKYVFINKIANKDGSESTAYIEYSNDIVELQKKASGFISWYNYPLGLTKDMSQNISQLK